MNKEESATFFRDGSIRSSIQSCKSIFDSGIFNSERSGDFLFESAVTFLLINLNDLLQKAKEDGKRVVFSDDIAVTENVKDVTDLVSKCRNAACHIGSGAHFIDTNKYSMMTIYGRCPNAFNIDEVSYGSEYSDDIAVYYGGQRLYLRRHALRAAMQLDSIYAQAD